MTSSSSPIKLTVDAINYEEKTIEGKNYIKLSLKDATEYLTKKNYTDNWESEMHETFCFWDFDEWKEHLQAAGFRVHPDSKVFTNPWIVNNRWKNKAVLYTLNKSGLIVEDYPVTTMFLMCVKS